MFYAPQLDLCNVLYVGLLLKILWKLQLAWYVAVKLLTKILVSSCKKPQMSYLLLGSSGIAKGGSQH